MSTRIAGLGEMYAGQRTSSDKKKGTHSDSFRVPTVELRARTPHHSIRATALLSGASRETRMQEGGGTTSTDPPQHTILTDVV